jgi:hypothetical protein
LKPRPPPECLDEIANPNVKRVTDAVLASDSHSGSGGLVRVAELSDGRPVAVKTYYNKHPLTGAPVDETAWILEEAQSAQLLDDLGIGPKFHGVFKDPDGKWNVVMDIVPGDFTGMPVSRQTLDDFEHIVNTLEDAGIEDLSRLQLYRTPDSRLRAIDPGSMINKVGAKAEVPPRTPGGVPTRMRMGLLKDTPDSDAARYLDDLSRSDPEAAQGLRQALRQEDPTRLDRIAPRNPPNITPRQLQKKFKHASDFGVTGNQNKQALSAFEQALKDHVVRDDVVRIQGTYTRGQTPQSVYHYLDPQTGLNVMTDLNGEFISGWKLSQKQLEYVSTTGKLGGG